MVNVTSMNHAFENCLLSNGDDRMVLGDEDGTNKYGCRVKPYDHLNYSSSTASTIGIGAYQCVQIYYMNNFDRLNDPSFLLAEYQAIRDSLRSYLGLDDLVDIALGSSGTDLELLPLICFDKKDSITNIVVGPDEVGSGIEFIGEAKHFSSKLPSGKSVQVGSVIEGFNEYVINIEQVFFRDRDGDFVTNEVVENKILNIIESKPKDKIILHMVFKSKTGIVSPSIKFLEFISTKFPEVLLVVDACQFRLQKETIRKFINLGAIVLLTGSKFYGAPPFCAAALFPKKIRNKFCETRYFPSGLDDYFSRAEMPKRWFSFDEVLTNHNNLGLLMRWKAALFEIKEFSLVDFERFSKTVSVFNRVCLEIQQSLSFFTLEEIPGVTELNVEEQMYSSTIVTFTLNDPDLLYDDAVKIYKLLLADNIFPESLRKACHIGQPVKIKKNTFGEWRASLRIALGSRFFADNSGKVEEVLHTFLKKELLLVFKKIGYLLENRMEFKNV